MVSNVAGRIHYFNWGSLITLEHAGILWCLYFTVLALAVLHAALVVAYRFGEHSLHALALLVNCITAYRLSLTNCLTDKHRKHPLDLFQISRHFPRLLRYAQVKVEGGHDTTMSTNFRCTVHGNGKREIECSR